MKGVEVGLTPTEVDGFAARPGVRVEAVENFLLGIRASNLDSIDDARANIQTDATLYGWNKATVKAIQLGVNLLERKLNDALRRSYKAAAKPQKTPPPKQTRTIAPKASARKPGMAPTKAAAAGSAPSGTKGSESRKTPQRNPYGMSSRENQNMWKHFLAASLAAQRMRLMNIEHGATNDQVSEEAGITLLLEGLLVSQLQTLLDLRWELAKPFGEERWSRSGAAEAVDEAVTYLYNREHRRGGNMAWGVFKDNTGRERIQRFSTFNRDD